MKPNTKPLSGMMELLPEEQIEFDRIMNVIKKHHAAFGFAPIDTPILERTETLLAKAGGETEQQIYRFNKGDTDLSMRFDLTVPTARFVAENISHLSFPFKRSQIGKVYRGERAQRGRFREFYQCDIDVIGRDNLSINYDAEVIAVIYEIFRELNLGKFTIRISNRNFTSGIIEALNLNEKSAEIMALIDRAEKISTEDFSDQMKDLNLGEFAEEIVRKFVKISGKLEEALPLLTEISEKLENNQKIEKGILEIKKVDEILRAMDVNDNFYKFDMLIVRGLDYYTGTVFETNLDNFKEIGSVSSGGRYDNLAENYSKEKLPGVGASIGLTRLFWCLRELELIKFSQKTPAQIMIIPFSDDQVRYSLNLATNIRKKGESVEVLLEEVNLKKAFKIADRRGVKGVIVVGEDEIKSGELYLQNMADGSKSKIGI